MAYIVMALYSYGLYSQGLNSYGLYGLMAPLRCEPKRWCLPSTVLAIVLRPGTNSAATGHKQCCGRPQTVLRSTTNGAAVGQISAAVGSKGSAAWK